MLPLHFSAADVSALGAEAAVVDDGAYLEEFVHPKLLPVLIELADELVTSGHQFRDPRQLTVESHQSIELRRPRSRIVDRHMQICDERLAEHTGAWRPLISMRAHVSLTSSHEPAHHTPSPCEAQ